MIPYIYKKIYFNNKQFSSFFSLDGERVKYLDNLSKINIFVGQNNSGKSRFLRELFKRDIEKFEVFEFNDFKNEIEKMKRFVEAVSNNFSSIEGLKSLKIRDSKFILSIESLKYNSFDELLDLMHDLLSIDIFGGELEIETFSHSPGFVGGIIGNYGDVVKGKLVDFSENKDVELFLEDSKGKSDFYKKIEFKKEYIPILRSLNNFDKEIFEIMKRSLEEFSILIPKGLKKVSIDSFYENRIRDIYGLENHYVFTGQKLYNEVQKMLLGDSDDRKIISEYENFLSKEFFNDKQVSLIPKKNSNVLAVKIDEEEKNIYDLGDGIQSIILLTFPLFQCDNGIFFIEEPEINLHPGLQRRFIEIILNSTNNSLKERNHQYFITTHSNHFLDLTFDYSNISVYRFFTSNESYEKKMVEQIKNGDNAILFDLGVKNSSVFLTNASIWVEGITDRLYIKKFLDLYMEKNSKKKFVENIDYSFVEYGGSNISHWLFSEDSEGNDKMLASRLCSKSLVIADKDNNKERKHKDFKKSLGDRYVVLGGLEIENLLSIDVILKVIKSYPKDKNFALKDKLKNEKFLNIKMGEFIDGKLKPSKKYSSSSRSIVDKVNFCKKAINGMTYKDLTPSSIKLSKKIYNFIEEQNQ